jgi:hypothetical protein
MRLPPSYAVVVSAGMLMVGASGFFASKALTAGTTTDPTTTTITISNGAPGPPGPTGPASTVPGPPGETGPAGPTGPAGSVSCPTGYAPGYVQINHPGGKVTIYTCVEIVTHG